MFKTEKYIISLGVLKTSSGPGNFSEEDCINDCNIKTRKRRRGKTHVNPRRLLPFFGNFLQAGALTLAHSFGWQEREIARAVKESGLPITQ